MTDGPMWPYSQDPIKLLQFPSLDGPAHQDKDDALLVGWPDVRDAWYQRAEIGASAQF